ncbi:hypothetical protein ASE60_24920 [Ensifer sp. Root278]|nr:hypothetical protein ASE60_24920 [Ensifer sp. Root278]
MAMANRYPDFNIVKLLASCLRRKRARSTTCAFHQFLLDDLSRLIHSGEMSDQFGAEGEAE